MRGQGVAVGLGAWPLVLPGLAAVCASYDAPQLYTYDDEVGVHMRQGYRPDVGGPGTGREAPGGLRRQVPHLLQLPPGVAAVAADEQGGRLRAGVDGTVRG